MIGFLPQGGGYVLPGALKVNDGFKECTFKFVSKSLWPSKFDNKVSHRGNVDENNMPEGQGSLAFTSGERFTGTFKGGLRNRVGQVK